MPSPQLVALLQRIDRAKDACLADEHGALKALQDAARAILTEESEKPSDFIQRVQWAEVGRPN